MSSRRTTLFITIALTLLTACGGARARPAPLTGVEGSRARALADSLRYPYTEADIAFMSGMIHHHAQAIVIAQWAPSHGASAELQRLTARIINAQQDEINLMQSWLRDRNQPIPEPNPAGMTMMHGDAAHTMLMPGMLTAEQMAELDASRGAEFDKIFLALMIQHHRGAVTMVRELFTSHGAGQDESIFKFASDVEVDQTTEIRRMMQMLLQRGGIPPQ